jgi:DNA-binding NarL/FixJ family response regulator
MKARVVITDDHAMVREGVHLLLAQHEDIQVVAEFGGGSELLSAAPSLFADVALIEIFMTGMNGLDTARLLRESFPHIKIIMLSMCEGADLAAQSLYAGASGYVVKKSTAKEIGEAIKTVMRGELYLDSHVSWRALENYMERVRPGELPQEILTTRQREILQLIAEGASTKGIAQRLQLSPKTVETYRAQIMERLDIHELAGLVRYAVRVGLVPLHN